MAHDTASNSRHFDFMGKRWIFLPLSLILIIASFYVWFERGEEKYGIDFAGGHSYIVRIEGGADLEQMRSALEEAELTGVTVQSFEAASNDYSIRVGLRPDMSGKEITERVRSTLNTLHAGKFEIVDNQSVGATIGAEVRRNALIAVILGLVGITLYVTVRFEFAFALGALVALFHDVIVAVGVYLWVGHTLNSSALAAALTIVGYSVNDTIVIFDRVREEIYKRRDFDLETLLNECLNYTLSRTLITSATTMLLVLSLLVFGGGTIQDLSLFLFVGMVSGVYSTIYIAAPVVLWWDKVSRGKLLQNKAQPAA